jgi:hypothetical protein
MHFWQQGFGTRIGMDKEIFSDGIGRITVIGGVVRADLVTFSPTETDASGQPRPIFAARLVMGLDAFQRASEKMQEAVQAIVRAQSAQPVSRAPSPSFVQAPPAQHAEPSSTNDRAEPAVPAPDHPFP